MVTTNNIFEVKGLQTVVKTNNKQFPVLQDINFSVKKGETLGIVGESGCGKSMTALSIMGLLPDNVVVSKGAIWLKGQDLLKLDSKSYRSKRGKEMSMIFQDPGTSLNPAYTNGFQIAELLREHTNLTKGAIRKKTIQLLKTVGIPRPEEVIDEYPHQLSGGMKQRVMIAMALACDPEILIADEPTTALDVTIQAQILDLIKDLQRKFGMTILLITHDLGVISEVCDQVIVMYAGEIVEKSSVKALFDKPKHPYTKGLIASTPQIGKRVKKLHAIEGTVPDIKNMPTGCRFYNRCELRMERCRETPSPLFQLDDQSESKCWLYEGLGKEVTE